VDIDGPNLTGATVTITANHQPTQDVLEFTASDGISGSYNATTGVLSLSGSATAEAYQTVLRSVRYRNSSENPITSARTFQFSIGQGVQYFPETGHYYEFITSTGIHWDTAKTAAESRYFFSLQGYLATITSEAENKMLADRLVGVGWIGASDAAQETYWRWVTGPENGTLFCIGNTICVAQGGAFVNWNSGEPNNSGEEDYGHMIYNTAIGTRGSWNDLPIQGGSNDYAPHGYIVEYGGLPGDPILQISGTVTGTVTAENDAPTISAIADRSTNEETATPNIAFTVSDTETAAASLTLSGQSSNTTLVPDENIVFGGSGSSRTVRVSPAANQTGTATITVTVSDGDLTTSEPFVLTVYAVNDAPTIENIPNQATNEDVQAGPIAFTVDDIDTDVSTLTLSGSSSNTTLVPNANISFGGSGANRTVTIMPAANQNGTTTITVTVSDGSLTSTDTFTLTVNPVNDGPTISDISDRSTNEDTSTGAIAFTVGDIDTNLTHLTLSVSSSNMALVAGSGFFLGGTGADNASGSVTITVSVSDGEFSASDSFLLTIDPINDAPAIANIANQTTPEDTPLGPVSFTVGDIDSVVDDLTLSGASSNDTLVPDGNIVFGGSGANRTFTITPAADQNGSATITITVSDGSLQTSDSFTFEVTALNDRPVLQPFTITGDEDTTRAFAAADFANHFSDIDGNDLAKVMIVSLPGHGELLLDSVAVTAGQEIDVADLDKLAFKPADHWNGSTTFYWNGSDGTLYAAAHVLATVTIQAVIDAPHDLNLSSASVQENLPAGTAIGSFTTADHDTGDSYTYTLVSGAGDDDNASFSIAGSVLQTGESFDHETRSSYTIRVRTTDADGLFYEQSFSISVLDINEAPFAAHAIVDQTTPAGSAFNYAFPANTFSDPDGDAMTYTAALADGSPLPGWLVFTSADRRFVGTPGDEQAGRYSIRVTASDAGAESGSDVFDLFVSSASNRSPIVLNPIPNQAVVTAQPFSFTFAANTFSEPDGEELFYNAALSDGASLPAWLAFDPVTRTFSGTPPTAGPVVVRVTAYEARGGSVSTTFTIEAFTGGTPPSLQIPLSDRPAAAGQPFLFTIDLGTFVDADGDMLTYTAALADGDDLPDWLTFDPETLSFTGTPAFENAGAFLVRVSAWDDDEMMASELFLIAVSNSEQTNIPVGGAGLNLMDGNTRVVIPAGATSGYTHLYVHISYTAAVPPPPGQKDSLEKHREIVVLDADGNPVAITGDIQICIELSVEDWRFGDRNPVNFFLGTTPDVLTGWTLLPATTTSQRICAAVNHFSLFDVFAVPAPQGLPETGFAPGRTTQLPLQPSGETYQSFESVWVEIPSLDVRAEIVQVPLNARGNWDVRWLGENAGWLERSAFPGWNGNSVLTGHATDTQGLPGLFAELGKLKWGDEIIIEAFGQRYVYEVRQVQRFVPPDQLSLLDHEELPWLTLITCQGYDEDRDEYRWRLAVRAVQVRVE
jgi:LPXTG-site transpeptidase (sortase) family protein